MLKTSIATVQQNRQLRVARLGSGPPLILLHGYPENLQIWSEIAPQLANDHEVIALDWPGMGYSEEWPGGATPAHLSERIIELMDHWQLPQASLMAMDMGAQPALVCAARHPDRISKLIVSCSLVFGDEQTSWEIRVLRKFGWNRFLIRHFPRLIFWRANRTFLPRGVQLPDELYADFWNAFRQPQVRKYVSKMCAGYQGTLQDLPEEYANIQCPTLILWAEHDKHFPPVHATRLHQSIANSQLQILPDASHWMVWHRAAEVAECVKPFLLHSKRIDD